MVKRRPDEKQSATGGPRRFDEKEHGMATGGIGNEAGQRAAQQSGAKGTEDQRGALARDTSTQGAGRELKRHGHTGDEREEP